MPMLTMMLAANQSNTWSYDFGAVSIVSRTVRINNVLNLFVKEAMPLSGITQHRCFQRFLPEVKPCCLIDWTNWSSSLVHSLTLYSCQLLSFMHNGTSKTSCPHTRSRRVQFLQGNVSCTAVTVGLFKTASMHLQYTAVAYAVSNGKGIKIPRSDNKWTTAYCA